MMVGLLALAGHCLLSGMAVVFVVRQEPELVWTFVKQWSVSNAVVIRKC